MKNLKVIFCLFILLTSCGNSNEDPVVVSTSSGNINNLNVIMDNELWSGEIGEAIRKHLAAPVDGLPQEEPLFSINQMPPDAFLGFARKNRIFLQVLKGTDADFKIVENPYARPQKGILITGETNEEIIAQLDEHAEAIIRTFKNTEIKEQQRRISKSLKDDGPLEENFGVSMKFPTAYRYAKETEDFYWIRKDIPHGSMEILVYEVPINTIQKDTNTIANIIAMRDSIGQMHIPGPTEGTYMITEAAYAPYLFESQIDGKFAWETRGTWEVKGAFMAGPFLNYAVMDEANDRIVVLEGFAFAPSARKRENMLELEAILRSVKFR